VSDPNAREVVLATARKQAFEARVVAEEKPKDGDP